MSNIVIDSKKLSILRSRITVAIILTSLVLTLAYYRAINLAYFLTIMALLWDYVITMKELNLSQYRLFNLLWIFAFISNVNLFYLYHRDSDHLLLMIAVVQTSDIYQYLIGSTVGLHRIGAISPKKTWEGYFGSLPLLILTFYYFRLTILEIVIYWIFGIGGGLLFSAVKRKLGIKDFSNLLGNHGGWLDRLDSIYVTGWILLLQILSG